MHSLINMVVVKTDQLSKIKNNQNKGPIDQESIRDIKFLEQAIQFFCVRFLLLREKIVTWVQEFQSSMMGKACHLSWERHGTAEQLTLGGQEQRERECPHQLASPSSSFAVSELSSIGWCHSYLGADVPLLRLILSGNTLTTHPKCALPVSQMLLNLVKSPTKINHLKVRM